MPNARAGILLLATILAASVTLTACQPTAIDGSPYSTPDTAKSKKKKKSSRTTQEDEDDEEESESPSRPRAPSTPSTPTEPDEPDDSQSTPISTPPPNQPPPVNHPSCASGNPLACLDCCLAANPIAIAFEIAYDDCLSGCFDSNCDLQCQDQHLAACAGNDACLQNHACLEANNCAAQNLCN